MSSTENATNSDVSANEIAENITNEIIENSTNDISEVTSTIAALELDDVPIPVSNINLSTVVAFEQVSFNGFNFKMNVWPYARYTVSCLVFGTFQLRRTHAGALYSLYTLF